MKIDRGEESEDMRLEIVPFAGEGGDNVLFP
jgi:hypothetical protein